MSDTITSVPDFNITFNGARLPVERRAEVKEIVVCDRVNSPSSFHILVHGTSSDWLEQEDYAIGSRVEIQLGHKDDLIPVIHGEVTGVGCRYRTNESVIISIRGQNALHKLARNMKVTAFNQMTDKEIIGQIASAAGLNTEIMDLPAKNLFTLQKNQTDFAFLLMLAERYDCFFHVQDKKLYFKQLNINASEDYVLEWGKTLNTFFPQTDTSHLITDVQVRGFYTRKMEVITGAASHKDIDAPGGAVVSDNWGEAKEIKVDHRIIDQQGADDLALNLLTHQCREYISGYGSCQGQKGMLAGTIVKLNGLGKRFSGKYFIIEARHCLKTSAAYEIQFMVTSNLASSASAGNSEAGAHTQSTAGEKPADAAPTERKAAKDDKVLNIRLEHENGAPASRVKYQITCADGKLIEGSLDEEGTAQVKVDDPGSCKVTFPDLDADSWDA